MLHCDPDSSVPDWIIESPATFVVSQSLGIDSSGGGKSLQSLCKELRLNPEAVFRKLTDVLHQSSDCTRAVFTDGT